MVLAIKGRSERPSAKKSLCRSGFRRGWFCMSSRQPTTTTASSMAMTKAAPVRKLPATADRTLTTALIGHLHHAVGLQAFQKTARTVTVELRVGGFDTKEEPVACGHNEAGHVEHRVVWHGKSVEREHAEHRRHSGAQHRHLKGDYDEAGPGVHGAAGD